jgi:hypothetical protein
MNRALALMLAVLALALPGAGAHAQQSARVVERVSWVEEWDPVSQRWERVEEDPAAIVPVAAYQTTSVARIGGATITETIIEQPVRFIAHTPRQPDQRAGIARFGPFRVIDGTRAALVDSTDAGSPQAFAAMLAAFPELEVIEFADAPGTSHDLANLALGRAIRAAGLATYVPDGGSARSGAVELFLAGTRRTVDPGALFAVHSWRDERGREPDDFAPDAPENRLYLDYYAEMGMTPDLARGFYAMTNSVPHTGALWLQGEDMARWIAPVAPSPATRLLDPGLESGLRLALARSGGALLAALRPPVMLRAEVPLVPQLAYADLGAYSGAGLLDSTPAFP